MIILIRVFLVLSCFSFFGGLAGGGEKAAGSKPQCLVVRAALDVGSGSTKLKVARVDRCLQKTVELLFEANRKVGYREALGRSADKTFDEIVQAAGLEALKSLKQEAEKFSPQEIRGVATAAFREAANAGAFLERVRGTLGIELRVLSQADEAHLGFQAAVAAAGSPPREKVVVWDIGGGSQQLIAQARSREKTETFVYEGKVASVGFKDLIEEKIQGKGKRPEKSKDQGSSPNPISAVEAAKAEKLAQSLAADVNPAIRSRLRSPGARVVGIGGVHVFSVLPFVAPGKKAYTRFDIQRALPRRLGKTDKEIGGEYAATEASNLLLVLGFMKGLGISRVEVPLPVNLADGLLVEPSFWPAF